MNKTINVILDYKSHRRRHKIYILLLFLLMVAIGIFSLIIGGSAIGIKEITSIISGNPDEISKLILYNIRLPRVLSGLLCGMSLAVSGAIMQTLLRNPLASPFTLGISNASAFGAAVAIVFLGGASENLKSADLFIISNPYIVTICAFAGSLIALFLVLTIAKLKKTSIETIILSGVIISSLFGAGIAAIQYIANNVQLSSIVFWTFGDLGKSDWQKLLIISIVLFPGFIYLYSNRWNYKALRSGDEYARSLGVNPDRLRISGLIATSLCTAIVVSFFGVIAFVGLVVPHIIKRIVGSNEEFLIPASAIFGGLFLVLCDLAARTILSPTIIPVGILTSFLGVPIFLFFLVKKSNK